MDLVRRMGGCDRGCVSVKSPANVFMHFFADKKLYACSKRGWLQESKDVFGKGREGLGDKKEPRAVSLCPLEEKRK